MWNTGLSVYLDLALHVFIVSMSKGMWIFWKACFRDIQYLVVLRVHVFRVTAHGSFRCFLTGLECHQCVLREHLYNVTCYTHSHTQATTEL